MADSTVGKMSEGQTSQGGGLNLNQPADAVKMKDFAQLSSPLAGNNTDNEDRADGANREPDSLAAQMLEMPQPQTSAAATPETGTEEGQSRSDKGKEKVVSLAPSPPAKNEDGDGIAIGASTDDIAKPPPKGEGPVCAITLLIASGKRHPYRIDEKYLAKRNVSVPGVTEEGKMDPFSISVYTLKELILREWRDEWEQRPASPSSIRLIHFGKLLNDKDQLKQYKFSTEASNVVHMSVRPTDIGEDEEPKSTNKSSREAGRDEASRCCVIL